MYYFVELKTLFYELLAVFFSTTVTVRVNQIFLKQNQIENCQPIHIEDGILV